jgi:hypothetical protein
MNRVKTIRYTHKEKAERNQRLYEFYLTGQTYKVVAARFHITTKVAWTIIDKIKRKEVSAEHKES